MKYSIFSLAFIFFLTLFTSCDKDNSSFNKEAPLEFELLGIKSLHDKYCKELVDSVNVWRQAKWSDEKIVSEVYDVFLIEKMSVSMGLTKAGMEKEYQKLGVTKDNYTTWGFQLENKFPKKFDEFFEDINDYIKFGYNNLTDEEFLNGLEEKKQLWSSKINPTFVNSSIEVAKSSFPFWRANVDDFLGVNNESIHSQAQSRAHKCRKAGQRIGFADLWGAGYGAMMGGLVGAMGGAISGTLGAAVGTAITGGC